MLRALKKYVSYDPQTGIIRCVKPFGRKMPGDHLGYRVYQKTGEPKALHFVFMGRIVKNHHVAWYFAKNWWPSWLVDHRNGNPFDNRLDNLRHATYKENAANRKASSRSSLGVRGVSLVRRKRKGVGYIASCGGKHLGTFNTLRQAKDAYNAAALDLYGEFARVHI